MEVFYLTFAVLSWMFVFSMPLVIIFVVITLLMDWFWLQEKIKNNQSWEDWEKESNWFKDGTAIDIWQLFTIIMVIFMFAATGFLGGCLTIFFAYKVGKKLSKLKEQR